MIKSNVGNHQRRKSSYLRYTACSKYAMLLALICVISNIIYFIFWFREYDRITKIPSRKLDISYSSKSEVISTFHQSELYQMYNKKVFSPFYSSIKRQRFNITSSFTSQLSSKQKVTIIALAGETRKEHPGFRNFLKSLAFTGYAHIKILKPPEHLQEILKLRKVNQSAESVFWVNRLAQFNNLADSFKSNDLLVFCDAFDVYFGLPPDILISRFRTMDREVIFSTEMLCDTVSCRTDFKTKTWFQEQQSIQQRHQSGHEFNNPYKFLNAGMFMGKVSGIRKVLKCAVDLAHSGRDDQTAFSMCYQKMPDVIGLDFDSLLFGNIPPYDPVFNSVWKMRNWDSVTPLTPPTDLKPSNIGINSPSNSLSIWKSLPDAWLQLLSIPPLLNRLHTPYVAPVVLHFPGMAFRPNSYIPFNPCQQNLRWRYNDIASVIFRDAVRPMLFHPIPNQYLRESTTSAGIMSKIVLSMTIDASDSGRIQRLPSCLSHLTSKQTWKADVIYLHLRNYVPNKTVDRMLLPIRSQGVVVTHGAVTDNKSYTDSEIINKHADTDSGLLQVLRAELDPKTIILVVKDGFLYDCRFVETLAARIIRNPVNAYGFQGMAIDLYKDDASSMGIDEPSVLEVKSDEKASLRRRALARSGVLSVNGRASNAPYHEENTRRFSVKSTAFQMFDSTTPVDYLLWKEGAVFMRSFFSIDEFRRLIPTRGHPCHSRDEVLVSAYLSSVGIPRMQLKSGSGRTFAKNAVPMSNLIQQQQRLDGLGSLLLERVNGLTEACVEHVLPLFQKSWMPPDPKSSEMDPVVASWIDAEIANIDIPPVADLPGFHWQVNWDLRSATSPCTIHLMTRMQDESPYLGHRQYMGSGQSIMSIGGHFRMELSSAASFCIYKDEQLVNCVIGSRSTDSLLESVEEGGSVSRAANLSPCYAAIHEGMLCVFHGETPYFGGTGDESGHREVLWCSESFRQIQSVADKSIRYQVGLGKHSETVRSWTAEEKQSRLYLHITDDGLYGLFLGLVDPVDIAVLPLDRVRSLFY